MWRVRLANQTEPLLLSYSADPAMCSLRGAWTDHVVIVSSGTTLLPYRKCSVAQGLEMHPQIKGLTLNRAAESHKAHNAYKQKYSWLTNESFWLFSHLQLQSSRHTTVHSFDNSCDFSPPHSTFSGFGKLSPPCLLECHWNKCCCSSPAFSLR